MSNQNQSLLNVDSLLKQLKDAIEQNKKLKLKVQKLSQENEDLRHSLNLMYDATQGR